MNVIRYAGLIFAVAMIITGCSGVLSNSVAPDGADASREFSIGDGTACLGSWQIRIDAGTGKVDISRLRTGDKILNALYFLEPPAHMNLTIDFGTLQIKPAQQLVSVDVILHHPILTPMHRFPGFDVRGVVFGPEVLNADGYTVAMNPADFADVPYGYTNGLLGTPNYIALYDGVWGYKYFTDSLGLAEPLEQFFGDWSNLDERGIFREGSTNSRHYELSWANTESPIDFLVFNYAVYANYAAPTGTGPFDIDDFSILTANCADAFCCSVTEIANSLWYVAPDGGGTISVNVEVFDWTGDTGAVELFSGDALPPTEAELSSTGSTPKSFIHYFEDIPVVPDKPDVITFYVRVYDSKTYGESWFQNLLPASHPMYGEQIYSLFSFDAAVADEIDNTLFFWTGESGTGEPMVAPVDFLNTWAYIGGDEMVWDENDNVNGMATLCTGTTWIHTPEIHIPSDSAGDFDVLLRLKHWGGANPPWLFEPDPTGFDSGGFIAYRIPPDEEWKINSDIYPWLTYSSGNNFNSVNNMNLAIGGAMAWCPYLGINYGPDVWEERAFGAKLFQNLWGSKSNMWNSTFTVDEALEGHTVQFGFYWGGLEEGQGDAIYPGWCIREIEVYKEPN